MLFRGIMIGVYTLNLKKMSGKNPQLCPFSGLFLPFLGYTARTPLFSRKSPVRNLFNIVAGLKVGRSVTF